MENRASVRRRTLKQALLILNTNGSVVDCLIRDLSFGGAGLWLHNWMALPRRFDLVLPGEKLRVGARLAWQRGQAAGVQFVGASMLGRRHRKAHKMATRAA
jgi:hypothetical protein